MEEICFSTATQLIRAIHARELSSQDVVAAFQARLESVNARLNAVTVTAEDALEQARLADERQAQGEQLGPLHGLPFTVKDTFETADLQSRLEARIRKRLVARTDAAVVARMKQAGAILLAKTNCPPSGSGADTENAIVGQTYNPHNASRSPGGSSGGEAALIAAGGSPLGLGSDTGGGLRVPAAFCGITALKPTQGRVPNSGVYNQPGGLTDQRTQIGPAARRTEDLLLALRTISGPDYRDAGVVAKPIYDPEQLSFARLDDCLLSLRSCLAGDLRGGKRGWRLRPGAGTRRRPGRREPSSRLGWRRPRPRSRLAPHGRDPGSGRR